MIQKIVPDFLLQCYLFPFHHHNLSRSFCLISTGSILSRFTSFCKCFIVFCKVLIFVFLEDRNFFLYEVGQVFSFVSLLLHTIMEAQKVNFQTPKALFSTLYIFAIYLQHGIFKKISIPPTSVLSFQLLLFLKKCFFCTRNNYKVLNLRTCWCL